MAVKCTIIYPYVIAEHKLYSAKNAERFPRYLLPMREMPVMSDGRVGEHHSRAHGSSLIERHVLGASGFLIYQPL